MMNAMTTFAESKKSNLIGANISAYSPENDQVAFQPDTHQLPSHFSYGFGQLNIQHSVPVGIQPKLTIGAPNDRYEQEADRVADRVMSMSIPVQSGVTSAGSLKVQRMCKGCEDELEGKLQTKLASSAGAISVTDDIEQGMQGLQGKGQPLPKSERAFFEPRFGRDLSHVRIHSGVQASQTSASIGARAFTLGNNIVFGQGEYQPRTTFGRKLMAHELTHVEQQVRNSGILSDQPAVQRKVIPKTVDEGADFLAGITRFTSKSSAAVLDCAVHSLTDLLKMSQGKPGTVTLGCKF
ncbi:MAG: DUF4157 domain-containing protein [Pseudomonadales bacterium]